MSNDKKFDLEERTSKFAEHILNFSKTVTKTIQTKPLLDQLIRAGTSIGSNYCEADCAESRKDFEHKLGICKKKAKETRYWLRLIAKNSPETTTQARILWREANELHLIFIAIINKSKSHAISH